ncbi:MAG: phage holin family protein [Clostridium sp.]|uniref:phage holin family protein n=1 Tax=Clostridium sp. TaxID=1506 RepID=UPI0029020D47|nr:phage holin family protein [Clostridium sp.]MDU1279232.1 phage holin family protein [Clostridium sp.]
MEFVKFIIENALILVPALYVIGLILKGTEKIGDKYIPVILLMFGIVGAVALLGFNINAVIQGILVTGAAVYTNQLLKQVNKNE